MIDWGKIISYVVGISFSSLFVIQIAPIKIKPFNILGKALGNLLMSDLKAEIGQLREEIIAVKDNQKKVEDKLNEVDKKADDNENDRIRNIILDFADSLRKGNKHTKEKFHQIVSLNEKYHNNIKARGLTNGVLDTDYAYIERKYQECLEEDDFLH